MDVQVEMAEMRAALRHLQDRQAILDCLTRECRGRDRQDEAMIASAYWEDGVDEHGPVITPALDYPKRANAGHRAAFSATSHNLTNHSCRIEGDTAYCETYVVGGLLSRDGRTCIIAPGRYVDQLERRGGEWRILVRRTVVDMCIEGTASWLQSPALAGFLRGSWERDDPSYQRPVRAGAAGRRW